MNRRSLSAESLTSTDTNVRKSSHTSPISNAYDRWTVICFIIGFANMLHGLWMLIAPKHWFYNLPADVPAYGPLNVHFIRDLGCVFFLLGAGVVVGAFKPSYRFPLFTMNTLFYLMHMLVHVYEMISGRVRMGMFWIDLPLIYVPTVIVIILNFIMMKKLPKEQSY